MKIYTKFGDNKQTSLFGGERISKGELRIDAYGDVDELSSFVGLLHSSLSSASLSDSVQSKLHSLLLTIQKQLFVVSSELANRSTKPQFFIEKADTYFLEEAIDTLETKLPPLTHFILPGGHTLSSLAHVCRTVTRRAERKIVRLAEQEQVQPELLKYINRLSDLFFIIGRSLNVSLQIEEIGWLGTTFERKGIQNP